MAAFRIAGRGRIDHSRPVHFTFDGTTYEGRAGDSVASALLANGVHLVGRSFKYHRPRGILTAGSEEPNALIGTSRGVGRREPNTRATVQEIHEGLATESQNRWPSLKFDAGAINDRLYMPFSAGFYCKTFMWPRSFWDKVYEPFIRAAAGLGKSPSEPDPDRYASRYLHCDVLIVGAGPAGLAAALAAGRRGAGVVVVDEQAEMGGSLLSEPGAVIGGRPAWDWLSATLTELRALANVRLLTRTTAIGYYHQNMVGLCQRVTDHLENPPEGAPRERLWRIRAKQVVLAQGSIEKPLVFDGNDRSGIMLAGAACMYLNRYGVKVGMRAVVVTSHDSAWAAAFDLAEARVKVAAIADLRSDFAPALWQKAKSLGIEVLAGHTVTGTSGRLRVSSVRVNPLEKARVGSARKIGCGSLLMCGGWTPSLHLISHTKGSLDWDPATASFLPGRKTEGAISPAPAAGSGASRRRSRMARRRAPQPHPPPGIAPPSRRSGSKATTPAAGWRRRNCRPTAMLARPAPSSISRTMSRPRTFASRCAKACARSSMSSATPPTAWRPIRASCRT
jgi:sarcosine oxidase subunit alpha